MGIKLWSENEIRPIAANQVEIELDLKGVKD